MTEPTQLYSVNRSELWSIDGLDVLVIRSRRKTLSIEVGQGGLKARAPLRMRASSIEQFIRSKNNWIERHLSNLPTQEKPLILKNDARLLLGGRTLTLKVLENHRGKISLQEGEISVPIVPSHLELQISIKNKLTSWYKRQAQSKLNERIHYFAPILGLESARFEDTKVRDYKRRWGSCDHQGRLSFNWRIIMAPPEVLDYVVVHELAHCHEFNHSKRFWKIVGQHLPEWKQHQTWLQNHGAQLYRI